MMNYLAVCIFAIICCATPNIAQENTGTFIASSIEECYNGTNYLDLDYEVAIPFTLNTLLDLIRKVEAGPNPMDLKMLSVNLLQRFRQDGILKATMDISSHRLVLPFSPTADENIKFKIILKNLIPGNAMQFPNETLSRTERCTVHHMLSTTIEKITRGDEDRVCDRTARYVRRMTRDTPDDVEILDMPAGLASVNGKVLDPKSQTDVLNRGTYGTQDSRCPIESGVIYTPWGAVAAGNLLAGIAAGCEPQNINLRDLGVQLEGSVDNIWGSTVAGDVAETAYFSKGRLQEIKLGADGGWNSVQIPQKYYLKDGTIGQYMTKAEIRGDLDGLILGTKMTQWKNSVPSMKLSQLIDMYYSHRGTFNQNIKACRRGEMYKEFVPTDRLISESFNFANLIRNIKPVGVSIGIEDLQRFVTDATDKLDMAVPSLQDPKCVVNNDDYKIAATDIFIFLDFTWNFDVIYPALSYLLDKIDINPYNSNFTIVNAQSGDLLVNRTNSILDFYLQFNKTTYQNQMSGFDMNKVIHQLEGLAKGRMGEERGTQNAGGKSMLALFVPQSINFGDNKDYIIRKIEEGFKIYIPDLRLLALTAGATSDFEYIVKDTTRDAFTLIQSSDGTNIVQSISPLVKRIQELPRRILSNKCGADWIDNGSEKQMDQYIEQGSINFYRMHPNYFFGSGTRKLKVKGYGNGFLNVCYSRAIENPRSSGNNTATQNNVNCKKINNDEYAIELNDPCTDVDYIKDCTPLYVSVEVDTNSPNQGRYDICREKGCRFPDSLKYTISLENFSCFSSAKNLVVNVMFLFSILCIVVTRSIFNN